MIKCALDRVLSVFLVSMAERSASALKVVWVMRKQKSVVGYMVENLQPTITCVSWGELPVCMISRSLFYTAGRVKVKQLPSWHCDPRVLTLKSSLISSDESAGCRPVPSFELITSGDNSCQSAYHIAIYKCSGSCGEDTGVCCKPAAISTLTVSLICKDASHMDVLVSRPINYQISVRVWM